MRSYPEKQDAIDDAIADNRANVNSEIDEDKLYDLLHERDRVEVARRTGYELAEISTLMEGWRPDEKIAPEEFKEFGDDIVTEYRCPKCAYEWSGKAK